MMAAARPAELPPGLEARRSRASPARTAFPSRYAVSGAIGAPLSRRSRRHVWAVVRWSCEAFAARDRRDIRRRPYDGARGDIEIRIRTSIGVRMNRVSPSVPFYLAGGDPNRTHAARPAFTPERLDECAGRAVVPCAWCGTPCRPQKRASRCCTASCGIGARSTRVGVPVASRRQAGRRGRGPRDGAPHPPRLGSRHRAVGRRRGHARPPQSPARRRLRHGRQHAGGYRRVLRPRRYARHRRRRGYRMGGGRDLQRVSAQSRCSPRKAWPARYPGSPTRTAIAASG